MNIEYQIDDYKVTVHGVEGSDTVIVSITPYHQGNTVRPIESALLAHQLKHLAEILQTAFKG